MSDRNEYMRLYMQRRRAAQRAALAGQGQGDKYLSPGAGQEITTEPGQLAETPGVYARYKWAWWLLGGLVIGLCAYGLVHMVRNATPEEIAALRASIETTEPGQLAETPPEEETEEEESTEPGQA